jgi:DNA modification methylase
MPNISNKQQGGSAGSPRSDVGFLPTSSERPNDLFREMAIVWLAINLIDATPRHVRRAIKKQVDGVVVAIRKFGFRAPILVTRTGPGNTYQVIDGHTRLEAARQLDALEVPCIVVDDLSDVDVRRLRLSLNKLQETGQWDDGALRLEINEIIEIDGDYEFPGFELAEIEAFHLGTTASDDGDPADDLTGFVSDDLNLVTRVGDVWILGDHCIYCGSARDGTKIAALLDGEVADAVFTDVPFNVPISGHVSTVRDRHPEFAEASGEMSRDEFVAFLTETLGNVSICLKPGGVFYSCIDWRHLGEMMDAFKAIGLELLNICVWVKHAPGMGGLYRSQHEMVFVGRRPGAGHLNNVQLGKFGRNRSNVWTYAGATGGKHDVDDDFNVHPTVKPIRLVMDALLDVTTRSQLVIDPFLGSGTTLLAAERTGRRCLGVEIEPHYVDLGVRRWQEVTGGMAIHSVTGQTFDQTAESAAACTKELQLGVEPPSEASDEGDS